MEKKSFYDFPIWKLGDQHINIKDQLEILVVTFSSSVAYHSHVEKRRQTSMCAMCGLLSIGCCYLGLSAEVAMCELVSIGCCYPGLSTEVKVHFRKTIRLPSLLYGIGKIELRAKDLWEIERSKSNIVNNWLPIALSPHVLNECC